MVAITQSHTWLVYFHTDHQYTYFTLNSPSLYSLILNLGKRSDKTISKFFLLVLSSLYLHLLKITFSTTSTAQLRFYLIYRKIHCIGIWNNANYNLIALDNIPQFDLTKNWNWQSNVFFHKFATNLTIFVIFSDKLRSNIWNIWINTTIFPQSIKFSSPIISYTPFRSWKWQLKHQIRSTQVCSSHHLYWILFLLHYFHWSKTYNNYNYLNWCNFHMIKCIISLLKKWLE